MAPYIWGDSNAWTIKVNGLSIDYYLTKAQEDISRGIAYEDLSIYHELEEILAVCYKEITDISGTKHYR